MKGEGARHAAEGGRRLDELGVGGGGRPACRRRRRQSVMRTSTRLRAPRSPTEAEADRGRAATGMRVVRIVRSVADGRGGRGDWRGRVRSPGAAASPPRPGPRTTGRRRGPGAAAWPRRGAASGSEVTGRRARLSPMPVVVATLVPVRWTNDVPGPVGCRHEGGERWEPTALSRTRSGSRD